MHAGDSATPLSTLNSVALDTETTGLDPARSRVIQIGMVRIVGEDVLEDQAYQELVNPHIPIPPESSDIHGITDDFVQNSPDFSEVADDISLFIGSHILIGYNIGFDLSILSNEFKRIHRPFRPRRWLDIAALSRVVWPGSPEFSLETIADRLKIPLTDRHTALGDAVIAARIFVRLLPGLRQRGVVTLAEAERNCRAFTDIMESHERQGWTAPVRETPTELSAIARIDSFPYRHRVRDIMRTPPIIVDHDTSLKQVAAKLVEKGTSSVFVSDNSHNTGIITERDLVRAFGSDEHDPGRAGDIMSAPLHTVPEDAHVYRALGQMRQSGIRHLGVRDASGELVGALTTGDLLKQRADDAIILGHEIDTASDVNSLAAAWARLPVVSRSLLIEDIPPLEITAIHSEELGALTKRAAELAENRMLDDGDGPPPVGYTVLVLGSGGRGESLLTPDQDNAIIYALDEDEPDFETWFGKLGAHIADILNDAGVRYCSGGIMARNAIWRGGRTTWKRRIDGWIGRGETADILNVDIFYDFRPVFGPTGPANDIWNYAYERAHNAPGFLKQLAAIATDLKPPIGFFGNIKTDDGRVNLKTGGMMAIVSSARLLALRHDIRERSTRRRLEALRQIGAYNSEDLANVVNAYEIMLSETLRQQLLDIEHGVQPTNSVDLRNLTRRRRQDLKWALSQVEIISGHVGDPMALG
ncbi:MAG: putative nucleotidyltransferase substrate binding domain-containing protein [Dichotomicrobium sp.]